MQNMEHIQKRYRDFWNRENDTPIIPIFGFKSNRPNLPPAPTDPKKAWSDISYIIKKERAILDNQILMGDAFPIVNPNLGPDFFGATLGADLIFKETTSYSVPFIEDWTEEIRFDPNNKWWKLMCDITSALVEDSKGEYMVGITDFHPGADGLVSLRGPENLCYDLYDQPEVFRYSTDVLLPVFKEQLQYLFDLTQKYQKGTTNWMGLYKEDLWYPVSSDFIGMISNEQFEEYVLPELKMEIQHLKGNAIFHLDGPGALKHLDSLLAIPELAGIQWVYGAGQPSAQYWLDTLKKIQKAGKCVYIHLEPEDVKPLLQELRPEGLFCGLNFACSEDDANDILRLAGRMVHNR